MTDVLKIALERRSKLQEEIVKLDEFVRMADALMRGQGGEGAGQGARPQQSAAAASAPAAEARDDAPAAPKQAGGEKPESAEVPRPSIIRRGLAAS